MPYRTEIAPLLIVTQLEQFDYAGATAIAAVMLIASFALMLLINLIQVWSRKRGVACRAALHRLRWAAPRCSPSRSPFLACSSSRRWWRCSPRRCRRVLPLMARSVEHTSELQALVRISYAVCAL